MLTKVTLPSRETNMQENPLLRPSDIKTIQLLKAVFHESQWFVFYYFISNIKITLLMWPLWVSPTSGLNSGILLYFQRFQFKENGVYLVDFEPFLQEETTSLTSYLSFLYTEPFGKRGLLWQKRIYSCQNRPQLTRRKNQFDRDPSLPSLPFPL